MAKIELLAPAGDIDSLHAAVENGADAIYLGGRLFNARQSASNFDAEQLKAAIDYSHMRDVKIYLTLNTLIADDEMREALDFTREAYLAGIDGVIVQDIGLAGALHKVLPDLPLHGSTQMTIYDSDGAEQLENMGFKRVVLAREVPAAEITEIVRNTSLEVEIFVHGALCVCYSGQCLMSSIIGGRSGNRGRCAQPCRLPYELVETGKEGRQGKNKNAAAGYLLSPKDLCLIDSLKEIKAAGVRSLKLEGRMKGPEYVAAVVGTYRRYLDRLNEDDSCDETGKSNENVRLNEASKSGRVHENDIHDLMQVFNRGGFSEGYFHGKTGRDMMCFEKPKNWGTYLGKVISYNAAAETVRIKLDQSLSMGDGIEIWNGDNVSPGTVVSYIRKLSGGKAGDAASKGTLNTTAEAGSIVEVGYVRGRINKDLDVYKTSDKSLNTRLNESWNGKLNRRAAISGKVAVSGASPIKLDVWDNNGNAAGAVGTVQPQKALNKALTGERLREQLSKTGGTPFEFANLEIELEDGLALPISEINEVRRKALADLEMVRLAAFNAGRCGESTSEAYNTLTESLFKEFTGKQISNNKSAKSISLYFYTWDSSIRYDSFEADRVYLPYRCLLDKDGESVVKSCKIAGQEVYIQLPVITRGNSRSIIYKAIDKAGAWGADGFLAGNPGTINFLRENTGLWIFGDIGLNIFNSFSVKEAEHIGLEGVTLSAELTLDQVNAIKRPETLGFEAVVYGRLPLMVSEYCPVGAAVGGFCKNNKCGGSCSKGQYSLKDRKDIEFPVVCDNISCRTVILNSNVLFIPELIDGLYLGNAGRMRLYVWDETPEQVNKLCMLHRGLSVNSKKAMQQYGSLIEQVKSGGYTKGHYLRGV